LSTILELCKNFDILNIRISSFQLDLALAIATV